MRTKLKKTNKFSKEKINLYILGFGQLGKLIYMELKKNPKYNIKGFIDINTKQNKYAGLKVYKNEKLFINKKNLNLALAVGEPTKRLNIIKKFRKSNFLTLILDKTYIENSRNIGNGTIVMPFAKILNNTKIGKFCLVGTDVNILHDVSIGNNCVIGGGSIIGANTYIEKNVLVGVGSIFSSSKKVIGQNSIICSGTVVHKNIRKNSKVIGNPFKYTL
jgi:acetyltransferase EpsM